MNKSELGSCRFCGQYISVKVNEAATLQEIEEAATLECGCDEAKVYKTKTEQINKAKDNIDKIFRTKSKDGKNVPIADTCIALMNRAVELMVDHVLLSVAIKVDGETSAKITCKKDGGITVERKETETQKLEA